MGTRIYILRIYGILRNFELFWGWFRYLWILGRFEVFVDFEVFVAPDKFWGFDTRHYLGWWYLCRFEYFGVFWDYCGNYGLEGSDVSSEVFVVFSVYGGILGFLMMDIYICGFLWFIRGSSSDGFEDFAPLDCRNFRGARYIFVSSFVVIRFSGIVVNCGVIFWGFRLIVPLCWWKF